MSLETKTAPEGLYLNMNDTPFLLLFDVKLG